MDDEALASWLGLREAADARSRADSLTREVAFRVASEEPLRALDLASGTGSNIRFLAPRLVNQRQEWLAVDRSAALLARQAPVLPLPNGGSCRVETSVRDLGTLDPALFDGRRLVTASALLDLVSASWLASLAAYCRDASACVLFTLTYDGFSGCAPAEPEDGLVRQLLNNHQRTDKGLGGEAAGRDGTMFAGRAFGSRGFQVKQAVSNWELRPHERRLQRQLIEGWAEAAVEFAPDRAATVADWLARRLAHVDAGRSHIFVSHDDLAAWLP